MQVILRDRIENLGNAGDVVDVKPGYGRNYLIPKGLAYEASPANVRRMEAERAAQGRKRRRDAGRGAQAGQRAMEGVSLTFNARAGQEGKLFGSITSATSPTSWRSRGCRSTAARSSWTSPSSRWACTASPCACTRRCARRSRSGSSPRSSPRADSVNDGRGGGFPVRRPPLRACGGCEPAPDLPAWAPGRKLRRRARSRPATDFSDRIG